MTSAVIVLALDTATAATTAAVVGDGISSSRTIIDPHAHVESLPGLIADVLRDSGVAPEALDVIACGVGPGPFTGLRVAISAATAMSVALGIPVVGVCTHDAIAWGARAAVDGALPVTVVTRARRIEVNWSHYDVLGHRIGGPLAVTQDALIELAGAGEPAIWAGDSAVALGSATAGAVIGPEYPEATWLARIVVDRLAAGEQIPTPADPGDAGLATLDPASARGESTQEWMLQRAAAARVLLPPRPLYLRRPDAVAPESVSPTPPVGKP